MVEERSKRTNVCGLKVDELIKTRIGHGGVLCRVIDLVSLLATRQKRAMCRTIESVLGSRHCELYIIMMKKGLKGTFYTYDGIVLVISYRVSRL